LDGTKHDFERRRPDGVDDRVFPDPVVTDESEARSRAALPRENTEDAALEAADYQRRRGPGSKSGRWRAGRFPSIPSDPALSLELVLLRKERRTPKIAAISHRP
jgi:hypothetical protein